MTLEPELFCEDGCLSDAGLQAVVDGTLDAMGRLEASEHLSFCDRCLVRYTDLLAAAPLETPAAPVAEAALTRIRRRTLRVFTARAARAAAAAALALALWSAGIFTSLVPARAEEPPAVPDYTPRPNAALAFHDFFTETGSALQNALQDLFTGFTSE